MMGRAARTLLTTAALALVVLGAACASPAASAEGRASASTSSARSLSAQDAAELLRDASRAGEVDIVVGLLDAGAQVDAANHRGFTPLILAAYHGHTDVVRALLAHGADPCRGDAIGSTALMGAAFRGHVEVVRVLLPRCPVDQHNGAGRTALMFAALVGNDEVRALLQGTGADERNTDVDGRTAQDWANTQR